MDDRRCEYTWTNRHGETLRCMLDKDHPMDGGHKHGFQRSHGVGIVGLPKNKYPVQEAS